MITLACHGPDPAPLTSRPPMAEGEQVTTPIRIAFADFWPGFDPEDNFFTRRLGTRFRIEVSPDPDFLVYSCFGRRHLDFAGIRVFFSGENVRPDFSACDYAFTGDHLDRPEHFRLPLYALSVEPEDLVRGPGDADEALLRRRFCAFVVSNPWCARRNRFFRRLGAYKPVDSGGRHLNNVGGPVDDKLAFIGRYKFTIAFENGAYPGYTTEKLVEPMLARSLPVYWGNPLVHLDFNPASFVNAADFGDDDEALVERIVALDRDDDAYLAVHREPWLHDNRPGRWLDPGPLLDQFERIFSTSKRPVARSARHNALRRARGAARLVPRAARWARRRLGSPP